MKNSIALLLFMLPLLSLGQTGKYKSDTAVINELITSWTVGLPEEREEPANIRDFNKFKSLFTTDAEIVDDINAVYKPVSLSDAAPYKTKTKTVEEYAHDLALEFKNLKVDSVYDITYSKMNIADSTVVVRLTKKISGEKYRQYMIDDIPLLTDSLIELKKRKYHIEGAKENEQRIISTIEDKFNNGGNNTYNFESTNRLLIKMLMKKDTIRISSISIETIIEDLHCVNDADNDGVIDSEDSCKKAGDLTALGCEDNDLDGINNDEDACDDIYGRRGNAGCPRNYFASNVTLSLLAGASLNSAGLSMPELDKLGYNSIDINKSQKGSLKNPSLILSPSISADLAYYFGKRKKNAGISLGITYTSFKATYEITDPAVYTFKSNDGVDDYRRRITLRSGSSEQLQYSIMNVPLLFKYRLVLGKDESFDKPNKWNLEFGVGPSLVLFNTKSKYNSNIDFEGLYQIDSISHDITYTDYFDNGSSWNVILTADGINQQSGLPGADTLFSNLHNADIGYDFATNKNYSGQSNSLSRSSFALNAMINACYKLDARGRLAFKFGVTTVIAPLADQSSGYKLIDKTTDPYNSIYNSKAMTTYFSFGIHAGLSLQW